VPPFFFFFTLLKVVCIDDQLLYIGSDNAYPSFNKEHGVWIENAKVIESWLTGCWKHLWTLSGKGVVV
jgi:hypothetical protein